MLPRIPPQKQGTERPSLLLQAAGALLLAACAGADELVELDELEQRQVDCRPVQIDGCYDAWNVRACFYVPPGCAVSSTPPDAEQ